jgi:hypothetical protein
MATTQHPRHLYTRIKFQFVYVHTICVTKTEDKHTMPVPRLQCQRGWWCLQGSGASLVQGLRRLGCSHPPLRVFRTASSQSRGATVSEIPTIGYGRAPNPSSRRFWDICGPGQCIAWKCVLQTGGSSRIGIKVRISPQRNRTSNRLSCELSVKAKAKDKAASHSQTGQGQGGFSC